MTETELMAAMDDRSLVAEQQAMNLLASYSYEAAMTICALLDKKNVEIARLTAIETAARAVVSQDGEMFSEFLDRVVALRDALAASGE